MAIKGIISYGVHIPKYRLSRKTLSAAMGWLRPGAAPGEKAIANHDEDSITMAWAAGVDCLDKSDRSKIDGLYFATSSAPYRERGSAVIIAGALGLRSDIRTADFTDSLKAGTTALLSASDFIAQGDGTILLCAADCRLGKPGSALEVSIGDGAAALLLGSDNVIAGIEGSYNLAYDFPDYRRTESDIFVRSSEERFIREEGYGKFIMEAISGLMKKYGLEVKDFAKVAYPCMSARDHGAIAKRLGFQPEQVQEPLLTRIGESGVSSPLILLSAMLEEAKPGDRILVASYGNGVEAISFQVTPEIEKVKNRKKLQKAIDAGKDMPSYERYCVFRNILPAEPAIGDGEIAHTQLTLAWRERKAILGLYGSRCTRCNTPQYPPQRICVNPECGAIDEMEDYCFADKRGTLFSYTQDFGSATLNPPLLYGIIDFEGGGRFIFELTDCEPDMVKTGLPVKMMLRRKYIDEKQGVMGYFWKAVFVNE